MQGQKCDEILKRAEKIAHAYSHLVAQSGTCLPASALPYPKETMRQALLLWTAVDTQAEVREGPCVLYGVLEDFLTFYRTTSGRSSTGRIGCSRRRTLRG